MHEGFHPAPPEATQSIRRADLAPEVLAYVDNLVRQLDKILARNGIESFRAMLRIPDNERFALVEGKMPIADFDLYVGLCDQFRTALKNKQIPAGDRESWAAELAGRPFAYDKEKARELGFAELRVEAHPRAQEVMDAIYNRDPRFVTSMHEDGTADLNDAALQAFWKANCADLPNFPEGNRYFFESMAEHCLSDSIDGDDPATMGKPTKPHIPRFGSARYLLAMDWVEFSPTVDFEKAKSLTPQTKAVMLRLFGTEDVTLISRDAVNQGLYADHDARVPSAAALEVIRELVPDEDPTKYELRLIRFDEYARVAAAQGFGRKRLSTQLDGYLTHLWVNGYDEIEDGDGHREGLTVSPGSRGSTDVRSDRRDGTGPGAAVRLVLSRKN